ncbi:MAG: CMGC/GSK protein kinase [Amphiamblys sp. WSBS2006]|nr:MAG: CMGC/GSK protein kinase [Amphiamblys sp. WSBS2006]
MTDVLERGEMEDEVSVMANLDHENLMGMERFFYCGEDTISLVMEYVPVDLYRFICREDDIPRERVASYMFQLLSGLAYLHSKNTVHGDLHVENVLVDAETDRIKICDFGWARENRKGEEHFPVSRRIFGNDIWSAASIFVEMAIRHRAFCPIKVPWEKEGVDRIKKNLGIAKREEGDASMDTRAGMVRRRLLKEKVGEAGLDLLSKMMEHDPRKRISASSALKHPFF